MFTSKFLHLCIFRHNQGRHKLALVGNDGHLINVTVYHQLGFNGLWSNVFSVGSLEEILDTVGQIQKSIFHVASISRPEPAVFRKSLLGNRLLLVIPFGNGTSMKLYLIIFPNTDLYSRQYSSDTSNPEISLPFTGNRGRTFRQAVSGNHIDSHRMHKLLHLFRYGSSCSRKEIPIFNADGFL